MIVFSIRSSLADWNDVPSGSMRPTILEGDRIFVNKLAYDLKVPFTTWHIAEWSNPQRGDIVVFFSPHDGKRLVKRVIGLPGDTIELRNNHARHQRHSPSNTSPSPRNFCATFPPPNAPAASSPANNFPARPTPSLAIPPRPPRETSRRIACRKAQYFMMGDNRDDSFDSRFWGTVERKQIVGPRDGRGAVARQEQLLAAALATLVHFTAKRVVVIQTNPSAAAGRAA